jgi:hypothetical protein
MTVMTRRNAICVSGFALATPLAGKLIARTSYGGPGASGTLQSASSSSTGNNRLNADLQAYVAANVPPLSANIRKGHLSPQDCQNLSSRLHLFARHIEGIDTEPFRASIVSSLKPSSAIDLSQLDGATQVYSALLNYDPDLPYSEFRKSLTFSPEQLENGRSLLAANSIPWHFHNFADAMKDIGAGLGARGLSSMSHLNPAWPSRPGMVVFHHRETTVHLEHVSAKLCGMTSQQWCILVEGLLAYGFTIAAILALGPASAAAIAIAASLGITAADLIAFLSIIAATFNFLGSVTCPYAPS